MMSAIIPLMTIIDSIADQFDPDKTGRRGSATSRKKKKKGNKKKYKPKEPSYLDRLR